ncbi:MAG: cryptochrome/photolyase family protein, partial [Candidatus Marinimicrobia bacterium]|nr:cryptochrome/photolyase family protein [Candidatus Neomarinimicrobiota bacterium]
MISKINIIFPNQLFKKSFILDNNCKTYLIEEFLFFNHYKFHKQKIAYHRSSMKKYYDYLVSKGIKVFYIDSYDKKSDIRHFLTQLDKSINEINIYNPVDTWLLKRIQNNENTKIVNIKKTPLFMSTNEDLKQFFREDKKSFSHAVFYKQQRNKLNILMNDTNQPIGGKYSFDADNRKKYPSKKVPPKIPTFTSDTYWDEAIAYTQKYFTNNPGHLSDVPLYPNDHDQSNKWLDDFLINRFKEFGDYEDAIVNDEVFLNHSVLTPMLNSGLILPEEIISKTLEFSKENDIPINSLEGFIRQIIGWREFIRGMYVSKGTYSRNLNFWKYKRKIPQSFYDGTTGILPVDDAIKKLLRTGYSH